MGGYVILWLDFETRSLLSLKDYGLDRYAKDRSTEVLMLAYALDQDEPKLWLPHLEPMPDDLRQNLLNPEIKKGAWNYNFEKDIFEFVLGIIIPQSLWVDPSVLCAYMSLPIGLHRAGEALSIHGKKIHITGDNRPVKMFGEQSKATKKMIKNGSPAYYFKDWNSHPEQWAVYCQYCLNDVIAERNVYQAAISLKCPITEEEQRAWELDQRMNETGVYIDRTFVENAKVLAEEEANGIILEMKGLTGLENPNSQKQMLGWLQERGYPYDSIDVEAVELGLKYSLPKTVKTVLELKQKLGGSAYKKLQSIIDRIGPDGRLRDQFVYHGAHTGRWCLAEGSMVRVKTTSGKVIDKPIETVNILDKVWDGDAWVSHDGVVFSGEKETITHDGISATPEHEVWVKPNLKIPLEIAKKQNTLIWRGTVQEYIIYRLISPSGKFYIGMTKSKLKTRWQQHKKRADTGINHPLYNAIRKYGAESFIVETIDYANSKENAQKLEIAHIANSDKNKLYNLSLGGDADGETGSKIFWNRMNQNPKLKREYLKKLSETKKGDDWSNYVLMSQQNKEWRKANPRIAYKMAYRAIRIARRNQKTVKLDTRPLIERLRWKYNRSQAIRLAITKSWKNKTLEQRDFIRKKISEKAKLRFSKMTLEEKRAITEKGRNAHISNTRKIPE